MKDRNVKLILGFFVLILFVGLSGNNFLGNNVSYSINDSEAVMYFRNLKIISDKHVSPGEKVYAELSANTDKIKGITVEMYSYKNKKSFEVELKDLDKKPYFIMPDFDRNVVEGYTYVMDVVHVSFKDRTYANFSTSDTSGLYINLNQVGDSSITLEKAKKGSVWRDFVDVRIPYNTFARLYENTYVTLHADTKNIVSISLEFSSEDRSNSFVTYLENIDTRPYFSINEKDAQTGSKYSLTGVNVYYKEGDMVFYSAIKDNENPYMGIGDERNIVVVEDVIEESQYKKIEDAEETTNLTDVEATNSEYNNTFGGIIILVLILLVALGIFVFLKDEDR